MKLKKITLTLFILGLFFLGINNVLAERNYLFQWDEGEGTNMPGWTWYDEGNAVIMSGHPGWVLNADGPYGGLKTYGGWGNGSGSYEKSDYGNDSLGEIDIVNRAPSTSTGGSFRIYDSGLSETYQSCWWIWYDGENLSDKGITNATTDRWSFYMKTHGTTLATETSAGAVFHVGTYLCGDSAIGLDGGCPREGPGNQHYYHYLYPPTDTWMHVELDRHPTHYRNRTVSGNDPAWMYPPIDTDGVSHPMHYYEHINQWYMEIAYSEVNVTDYRLDEMYFYSTQDPTESAEPNQNDDSITSVLIGYNDTRLKWYIAWQDMSFTNENGLNLGDTTLSTFEIRWSTSPITNANYNSAAVVAPEWTSGADVTSYPNGVRRQDSWRTRIWTQFELPTGTETNNNHIYFAIKDVSSATGNAGTNWPYNVNDGHNSPSPYIHTIDYYIPETTNTLEITTNTLEDAYLNVSYNTTLEAQRGTQPYTWNATSLPGGITLSTDGVLSGIPTETGIFPIDITLSDAGDPIQNITTQLNLSIYNQENCTDGIDNDGDTLIDCQDDYCEEHSTCSTILVDFGSSSSNNIFNTDWTDVFMDSYVDYSDIGPGGVTTTAGSNGGYNYQGVKGENLSFQSGDKIKVYWYNNHSSLVNFTPIIHFTEEGRPAYTPNGWNSMSNLGINSESIGASEFTFNESNQGEYGLANVSSNSNNTNNLVCDKIVWIHNNDNGETPIVIRADVDQQNGITSTDAMLLLRNSLELDMSATNWQSSNTTGDVNCDNLVTSTDAMLILRYSLGLDMSGSGWCVE